MESFQAIEKLSSTPNLSVEHFADGTIKLADVMEEVQYLKQQIATIRQQMASFLTALANMPATKPQQIFDDAVQRVTALQKALEDYVERYRKLVPLLEIVQKDMALKVPDRLEAVKEAKKSRKKSYSKKTSNAGTPQGFTPQFVPHSAIREGNKDGSEGQPILL